jgi:hypothetical protein
VPSDHVVVQPASGITENHDWWPLAEQLAVCMGEPLLAQGVSRPSRPGRASKARSAKPKAAAKDQLALDLGR